MLCLCIQLTTVLQRGSRSMPSFNLYTDVHCVVPAPDSPIPAHGVATTGAPWQSALQHGQLDGVTWSGGCQGCQQKLPRFKLRGELVEDLTPLVGRHGAAYHCILLQRTLWMGRLRARNSNDLIQRGRVFSRSLALAR